MANAHGKRNVANRQTSLTAGYKKGDKVTCLIGSKQYFAVVDGIWSNCGLVATLEGQRNSTILNIESDKVTKAK